MVPCSRERQSAKGSRERQCDGAGMKFVLRIQLACTHGASKFHAKRASVWYS